MSQQRNRMRALRCGEKSKRGCVCSQHYFFDADARLDHARGYGPKNQGDDACCNYPTVSASTHNTMTWELAAADQAQRPPPETPGRLQESLKNYLNRPTAQRGGGWELQ